MTTRGLWQVKDGNTLGVARDLLRTLLDQNIVDALLVPMQGANGSVMPALVKHSSRLAQANPFAPVMAFNSARLVAALTRENTNTRLGVVLRSCEIRAVIELAKFNQAKLDGLVIIGVDCLGTFTVPEYANVLKQSPGLTAATGLGKDASLDEQGIRSACAICERPAPTHTDISIGLFGVDTTLALVVDMRDDLAEKLGLAADSSATAARQAALGNLIAARTAKRDAEFKQFHDRMRANGGIASYFANCLECTNCMNACPICYCKECFFRTSNSERTCRDLYHTADRQGALNLPADTLLFQLTRLNHMATSCVGCGMCEAACPQDIPLTTMFRSVGARVQRIFEYEPGRDVNEKPPFMVFQRDELQEIGEG